MFIKIVTFISELLIIKVPRRILKNLRNTSFNHCADSNGTAIMRIEIANWTSCGEICEYLNHPQIYCKNSNVVRIYTMQYISAVLVSWQMPTILLYASKYLFLTIVNWNQNWVITTSSVRIQYWSSSEIANIKSWLKMATFHFFEESGWTVIFGTHFWYTFTVQCFTVVSPED